MGGRQSEKSLGKAYWSGRKKKKPEGGENAGKQWLAPLMGSSQKGLLATAPCDGMEDLPPYIKMKCLLIKKKKKKLGWISFVT